MVFPTIPAMGFVPTGSVVVAFSTAYLTSRFVFALGFVVAILLTVVAAEGLWDIQTDRQPQVAGSEFFW